MHFIVFDTEDNSRQLMESGRSGFDKQVTQIAALEYHDGAVINRFHNRGNVEQFLEWIDGSDAGRIYAHNLQYDLGALFAERLPELALTMVGGRIIKAVYRNKVYVDSYNLFPTSVAALGKALKLEKLEFDEHSEEYVFRDCEIVGEAINNMVGLIAEYDVMRLTNTLGGLCVKLWQSMGGQNWMQASEESRSAIYGGRVELFSNGGTGNIAWVDINSLYPWCMTKKYPTEFRPKKKITDYGISNVTIEIPEQGIAPLPYRTTSSDRLSGVSEGSIIFPCGKITGTWIDAEIINAVENHGCKVKKLHWSYGSADGEDYYSGFVNEFYAKRLKAESDAYKLIYKLLMNNLYGQLGMGGVVSRTTAFTPEMRGKIATGQIKARPFGDNLLVEQAVPLPPHVNYVHAAHVTGYGRLRLMEFMRKIPLKDMIYCDTDSLFFFSKDKKLPFKTGSELGEMKLEGWGGRIDVYAPKMYSIDDVVKAKGVPRRLAKQFIENGQVEYDAPFKLREAINFYDRGNTRKLSVWRKVKKEIKTNYQKKILVDGKTFNPLQLPTSRKKPNVPKRGKQPTTKGK